MAYELKIPNELYDEIRDIGRQCNLSPAEVVRRFLKLGLVAAKVEADPAASLLIRDANGEREIAGFLAATEATR
jgi:hypothetical protein